jgi:hypothetical protein
MKHLDHYYISHISFEYLDFSWSLYVKYIDLINQYYVYYGCHLLLNVFKKNKISVFEFIDTWNYYNNIKMKIGDFKRIIKKDPHSLLYIDNVFNLICLSEPDEDKGQLHKVLFIKLNTIKYKWKTRYLYNVEELFHHLIDL